LIGRFYLAGLLTLGLLFASLAPAAAATPTAGSGPANAIALTGTLTGSLAPQQTRWYQFAGDGATTAAVTLQYSPALNAQLNNIGFNVDWTVPQGQQNVDWPGYYRVGQGGTYSLPIGQLYWVQSPSTKTSYWIELVNNSNQSIGYALGLTGSAFPPPFLNPPAPGAPVSTAPAAPTPAATTPAPTATPTAATTPVATNTATDRSGLILDPQVSISGPFSTVALRVDSNSPTLVQIYRVRIMPPNGAVVDGVTPSVSQDQNGVTWFLSYLVNNQTSLTGYSVRFFGPANGAQVEVDWSTASDKGALQVTISGAPNPAPPGSLASGF
jgi:hypothetical protein